MGIWWNHKRPERWQKTNKALEFFKLLWNAPVHYIAVENPVGYVNSHFLKPSQVINPWQFGHQAHKPTCLWLKNLPNLKPTNIVDRGEFYLKKNGERLSKWSHKTSGSRTNVRAKISNRTFEGIASAMADQWTAHFIAQKP